MIVLTEAQKEFVSKNWDKLSIIDLTRQVFNDNKLDGRCVEARVIKTFLGEDRKPSSTAYIKVEPVMLSEENKEYIKNNLLLRPIEIARIIFQNPNVEPLGRHVQAVKKYMVEIGGSSHVSKEDLTEGEYRPPVQLAQVVKKVNDYARKDFELATMSTLQKRNMEALKNFLHSPRFLQMINSYVSQKSRNVFEQEFVRAIYDKPDLTPDELNLYVNLCANYVLQITINRQLDMLNEKYEQVMLSPDAKITTPFADMIKAKTDELNKCDKRQSELIDSLNGKRRDRIIAQKVNSASIANLIDWWKEETERAKALAWAEKESLEASEEIDKLETLSEMKARILGISKSEMLHG